MRHSKQVTTATIAGITLLEMISAHAAPLPDSWSGFFIGAQAGGIWDDFKYTGMVFNGSGFATSFSGGPYMGFRREFGQIVVGADIEVSFNSDKATNTIAGATFHTQNSWTTSFLGQVGYAPSPAILFYITGGPAIGNLSTSFVPGISQSGSPYGESWGAGLEYKVAPKLAVRVQYLQTYLSGASGFGDLPTSLEDHALTAGIEFSTPIVAR
jgi:outer membrane immunogenic protein